MTTRIRTFALESEEREFIIATRKFQSVTLNIIVLYCKQIETTEEQ